LDEYHVYRREDDAIVVELYGQQFYWARVSGEDNVLGKRLM
jgi:hypothetical protein